MLDYSSYFSTDNFHRFQLEAEDPDTDPARLTYTLSGRPVPSDVETKIKVYSNGTVYTTEPFDAEQISHFSAGKTFCIVVVFSEAE